MDIKKALGEWGINAIALVSGTIGAFIVLAMDEKEFSFRSAVTQILSALAFSAYGTELIVKWWHLENSPSLCGLVGLCLGLCGRIAAKGVIKWAKGFEKDPLFFIKNRGGNTDEVAND